MWHTTPPKQFSDICCVLHSSTNSDIIYSDRASHSIGEGLCPTKQPLTSDANHKLSFYSCFWLKSYKTRFPQPPSWVQLICYSSSQNLENLFTHSIMGLLQRILKGTISIQMKRYLGQRSFFCLCGVCGPALWPGRVLVQQPRNFSNLVLLGF